MVFQPATFLTVCQKSYTVRPRKTSLIYKYIAAWKSMILWETFLVAFVLRSKKSTEQGHAGSRELNDVFCSPPGNIMGTNIYHPKGSWEDEFPF